MQSKYCKKQMLQRNQLLVKVAGFQREVIILSFQELNVINYCCKVRWRHDMYCHVLSCVCWGNSLRKKIKQLQTQPWQLPSALLLWLTFVYPLSSFKYGKIIITWTLLIPYLGNACVNSRCAVTAPNTDSASKAGLLTVTLWNRPTGNTDHVKVSLMQF